MQSNDVDLLLAIERATTPSSPEIAEAKRHILRATAHNAVPASILQDLLIVDARLPQQLDRRHAIDARTWNRRDTGLKALRHTRFWRAGNLAVVDLLGQGTLLRVATPRSGDRASTPGRLPRIDIPVVGANSSCASVIAPVVTVTGACQLAPRYADSPSDAWLTDPALFAADLGAISTDRHLRQAIDRTLAAYRAESATAFASAASEMLDVAWSAAKQALGDHNVCAQPTSPRDFVLTTVQRSRQSASTVSQLGGQERSLQSRLISIGTEPSFPRLPVSDRAQSINPSILSDAHRLLESIASAVATPTHNDLNVA